MLEKIMSKEELELANSRIDEAEKLLEAASLQLMRFRPFYGVMLASMPLKAATSWMSTMGTDGRNLYYAPEFVAGMTDERKKAVVGRIDKMIKDPAKNKEMKEFIDVFYRRKTAREICFVLEHECRHVVGDHMVRGRGFDPSKFNIAADHYINTNLVEEHSSSSELGPAWFPQGRRTVFDPASEFGFMKWGYCDFKFTDMYSEQIYEILFSGKNPDPNANGAGSGKGMKGVDMHQNNSGSLGDGDGERHSDEGSDGELGSGDLNDVLGLDNGTQPTLTQDEKNYNDSVMRRAIETACQAAGKGAPADARKFVEEAGKPKINYLRLLRRTIERLFKDNVSYRRLSRRSYSLTRSLRKSGHLTSRQTVGLPSYTKAKTIRAHIGFDVSGSFNDSLLKPTIREIKGLCNQYDDFEVTLFCWSTKVGAVHTYTKQNVKELSDYKITTTGGTDVRCVFEELDKQKHVPDQVVIYTDGYFSDVSQEKDWAKKYGDKTLWVILGRHGGDWTPPFGNAVDFDKYL